MSAVLKWTVPVDDEWHPIGSGPVALVAAQHGPRAVQVWTIEGRVNDVHFRSAKVIGTGQAIPESTEHIGSTVAGEFVWHVFASAGESNG